MQPKLPEKPKFISQITGLQKVVAGISGSMFSMALVTLIPLVSKLFEPNYILFLSTLRMVMATIALVSCGFVGIPQIWGMLKWVVEFYEFYKRFKDTEK